MCYGRRRTGQWIAKQIEGKLRSQLASELWPHLKFWLAQES
jgi:hypothetical protein